MRSYVLMIHAGGHGLRAGTQYVLYNFLAPDRYFLFRAWHDLCRTGHAEHADLGSDARGYIGRRRMGAGYSRRAVLFAGWSLRKKAAILPLAFLVPASYAEARGRRLARRYLRIMTKVGALLVSFVSTRLGLPPALRITQGLF